ncbi:hypothetical protein M378DRAFT_164910, partial [Amanita muscaria Koide BX008]
KYQEQSAALVAEVRLKHGILNHSIDCQHIPKFRRKRVSNFIASTYYIGVLKELILGTNKKQRRTNKRAEEESGGGERV